MNHSTNRRESVLLDEGLELLTEQQCRALLAVATIGRIGVTVAGLPVILPVSYVYVGSDIVFRTGKGTKLRAASAGAVVAFEIDGFDEVEREGWSVLIVGRATTVTDADELEVLRMCGPTPWVGGERDQYVRVVPEMLTGRRIVSEDVANENDGESPAARPARSNTPRATPPGSPR